MPTEDIESYWEGLRPPKPEPIKLEKPKLNPVFQAAIDQSDADIRQVILGHRLLVGLPVGPQGSTNPPEPPRGTNGPSGPVSPLRDFQRMSPRFEYPRIDFESEGQAFLENQPPEYVEDPILRARYQWDNFSGICISGVVDIMRQIYNVHGRRYGYGDVLAGSIDLSLQQLMAAPTNAAIYMIGRAWNETIHRLLQPTVTALEMGSPEAPPIPQGPENRRLRHG